MDDPHAHGQLTAIALVAVVALVCGVGMARLRQPAVVGYILAGLLLGPSALGLVQERESIRLLAELGVLMLLFLIGMELSLRAFREVWTIALFTTLAQIVVGVGAMLALSHFAGWSLELAVLLGFTVALSSTAVAIKLLEEIGELRTRVGQVTVGVLIAQDLAVVPMMLLLNALAVARPGGGGHGAGADPGELDATAVGLDALLKVGLSVGFLVLLILYLSRRQRIRLPFAQLVGGNVDLTPLAGLGLCFGGATLSGLLGLSPAYGAFLAGLVIGNSTGRATMLRHTAPVQAVLLMVFFLSVGLLIDLRYLWANLGTVLLLLFFVMVLKTLLNVLVIRLFGEAWPRAFLAGATLAQIGEFSFVLAAVGLAGGIASPEDHRLIVALTVVSLVAAPLYLALARRLHRALLLGITSGREALRLTFGPSLAAAARAGRGLQAGGHWLATAAAETWEALVARTARLAAGPPTPPAKPGDSETPGRGPT